MVPDMDYLEPAGAAESIPVSEAPPEVQAHVARLQQREGRRAMK
jgi:hypothetical protein